MPVFVFNGPSGVVKCTLIRTLRERVPELELAVSATTRAPRPGEEPGVDYHFLTDEEFEDKVQSGAFVEHARYSGSRYGTLRSELESRGAGGQPVLLEIEVQGARQVREAMPEAVQVFIAPPSEEALRTRLIGRGTDSHYACVLVAAKRARQINSYYHNLGEGTFDEYPPPMVETGSKNYLKIALEEIAAGKINYRYR